jgi:hypothetical protein
MRNEILFERYGRAALGRKFPYLRAHLKDSRNRSDLVHLCGAYGAALALRDKIRRQPDCDPVVWQAIEANCDELEAEATWSMELPSQATG